MRKVAWLCPEGDNDNTVSCNSLSHSSRSFATTLDNSSLLNSGKALAAASNITVAAERSLLESLNRIQDMSSVQGLTPPRE